MWISQKHKKNRYVEKKTFFLQIKKSLITHQGLLYGNNNPVLLLSGVDTLFKGVFPDSLKFPAVHKKDESIDKEN